MKIEKFLSTVKYDDLGILCSYVYINYIKDNKKAFENFVALCKWDFRSDNTFDMGEQPEKDYKEQYGKAQAILRTSVDNLIEQEVGQEEFYDALYKNLTNKSLFASDDDVVGALIYIVNNDKIPYFFLEKPVDIDEDEFSELYEKLNPDIQKCLYIINRGYEFRTEVASQLLRVIESKSDEKEKIVVLTGIMHYLEWMTAKSAVEEAEDTASTEDAQD